MSVVGAILEQDELLGVTMGRTSAYGASGTLPPPGVISPEEGRKIFDRAARRKVGMSGSDFLRAWDEGRYADLAEEDPRVQELLMMIPLVRAVDAR
jgi:hypothetical protein